MARLALPIQEAIRDLTGDLLGRGTAVDKAEDALGADDMAAVGVYRDDAGEVQAALPVDRALVPILGGALVMVPEVAVQEIMRQPDIPENLYENFWEVANIMASLLNRENGPHVVLAERHTRYDDLGPEVRAVLDAPVRQRWFSVTVSGYGSGRLGFVAAH